MNKSFLLACSLLLGLAFTNIAIAETDPCDSLEGGWNGDIWNLKDKTGCRVYYRLYKSYENIHVKPVMYGLDCTLIPKPFNAVCKQGEVTATIENKQVTGRAYTGMVDLRSDDYVVQLYKN